MGGHSTAASTQPPHAPSATIDASSKHHHRALLVLTTLVACGCTMAAHDDAAAAPAQPHIFEDFGLPMPNVEKANISQEEYAAKMSLYLTALRDAPRPQQDVPRLLTYDAESQPWRRRRDASVRLRFDVQPSPPATAGDAQLHAQSAEVRVLFPPQRHPHGAHVRVYQLLGARRRRLLAGKVVHLAGGAPQWTGFDVSRAAADWLAGRRRNLGLQLACDRCALGRLRPVRAALNVLAARRPPAGRARRSAASDTDCAHVNGAPLDARKPKCCRHRMHVDFGRLNMSFIIQPKGYEAGYCRGRCPHNFNYATNHSHIQNLVHRLDKRATPRTCCAPSRLQPLELLMVDPNDASKLTVHRWDNMVVVDCACS